MIQQLWKRLFGKRIEPADYKIARHAGALKRKRDKLDPKQAWRDIENVRARDLERTRAEAERQLEEIKRRIGDRERRGNIKVVK
jgi:hypothetical protein